LRLVDWLASDVQSLVHKTAKVLSLLHATHGTVSAIRHGSVGSSSVCQRQR
jgi:hypothetical protein